VSCFSVIGDYTLTDQTITYPKNTAFTPISSFRWLTIKRVVPVVQETSFLEQSAFYMEDLERTTDYSRQIDQQLTDDIARCVKVPIGSNITPESYLATIQTAVTQAQSSATVAQNATQDMPAVPFREVINIGGTNPFNINSVHNGYLMRASVGVGGLTVNLPQMSGLTFPYLFAVKRHSGSATLSVVPFAGDTIDGASSYSIGTVGQTVIFIANGTSLLGTWTAVTTGDATLADGSIVTAKFADKSVTAAKIADNTITSSQMAVNSVNDQAIVNNSVVATKIAPAVVGRSHCDTALGPLIDAIPFNGNPIAITSATTLSSTHRGRLVQVTAGSAYSITLPAITSLTAPYFCLIRRDSGANAITIARTGTDTFNGANTSYTLSTTVGDTTLIVADYANNRWYTMKMAQ